MITRQNQVVASQFLDPVAMYAKLELRTKDFIPEYKYITLRGKCSEIRVLQKMFLKERSEGECVIR